MTGAGLSINSVDVTSSIDIDNDFTEIRVGTFAPPGPLSTHFQVMFFFNPFVDLGSDPNDLRYLLVDFATPPGTFTGLPDSLAFVDSLIFTESKFSSNLGPQVKGTLSASA